MIETKVINYDRKFIDFIQEIKKLRSFGFQWYGYRVLDYTKKCACNIDSTNDRKGCSRCFRTGYVFTDHLVKGYSWIASPGHVANAPLGTISTQTRFIILEWDQPMQKYGYILELFQNAESGHLNQPFKIMRAFEIQDYILIRGQEGRIEWARCLLEERNLDDGKAGPQGTNTYKGNRSVPDV